MSPPRSVQVQKAGYGARSNDVYVASTSHVHETTPKGIHVAFVSTRVETAQPLLELQCGVKLLGPVRARQRRSLERESSRH